MENKILLIGQDKVGKTSLSGLLSLCELSNCNCVHIKSVEKAKNTLAEQNVCLVLIHISNIQKLEDLIDFIRKNYAAIPILSIMRADRILSQRLIAKGVYYVIPPEQVSQISLMQSILSAQQRKRVESELRNRDEIQKAINYAAEVFLSKLDWGSRINEVLGHLGNATQSDRVYIYRNEIHPGQNLSAVKQAEWTNTGSQTLNEYLNKPGTEIHDSFYSPGKKDLNGGNIFFGNTIDFPLDEQANLIGQGIQTIAIVPIFSDQVLWGFIGFDHCAVQKNWSSSEIDALKTAAKIIGAAVARQDAESRLTHLATHDYLTNLPNRMLLEDRFELAVSRSERGGKKFGIVSID